MSKKIRSLWRIILSSIITLLGFTACKTTKKVQKEDSMMLLYGPPPGVVERKQATEEVVPLYGAPPVKTAEEPKEK
ncbi:MAG: hypothetical protein II245_01310 [Bacteroidaceae bacterium]|nr:hypothetical protein [Bacteroidaceae bacterium]